MERDDTMKKGFEYSIDQGFLWSEVNLKGERKYYVEGYASTIDEDLSGEIINMEAQRDMLVQIKGQNITLDLEHEEWYDDNGNVLPKPKNEKIPVAKIVDAELREKGVWVKAEINRNIPSFRSVWNSIKEGFLKAFSVAFYPVAKAGKEISKLNLVNVTLTGSPVNQFATFNAVMKSAKAYLDSQKQQEEEKMTDEEIKKQDDSVQPEVKAEEVKVEEKQEEVVEQPTVKAEEEAEETVEAEVKAEKEELESLKAEIKALQEVTAKLKAELEKPVMKAVKEETPEIPVEEQRFVSPLKLI